MGTKTVIIDPDDLHKIETPRGILKALDALRKDFSEVQQEHENKLATISWRMMCLHSAIGAMIREGMTGPASDREEVVGTSTKGKNANMGNTGFSGGCPAPLAAARHETPPNILYPELRRWFLSKR